MTPTATQITDIGDGWYRVALYCDEGGSGSAAFRQDYAAGDDVPGMVFEAMEAHPRGMMIVSDPDSEFGKQCMEDAWADGHNFVARELNLFPPEITETAAHNLLPYSEPHPDEWRLTDGSQMVYGMKDPFGGNGATELTGKTSVGVFDVDSKDGVQLFGASIEKIQGRRLAVSMCVKFKPDMTQ